MADSGAAERRASALPDLKFAIGLEPAAAVEYLRSKNVQVSDRWHEVWQQAHARAFTVAGVARDDVLADIQTSLKNALAKGETFAQWRDGLNQTLENRGWIGRAGVDKSGEFHGGKIAPHRLDTIFRTNMQSSYMAGRYEAQRANLADRPYWQYVAVLDGRTRPAHRALAGRTFRADDPFWRSFYPPNGFRCRCRVRALSQDQVGTGEGQTPLSESKGKLDTVHVPVNPGRAWRMPVARFETAPGKYVTPDVGWSYNPAEARALYDPAGFRADAPPGPAPSPDVVRIAPGQKKWSDYGRPHLRDVPPEQRQPAPPMLGAADSAEAARDVLANALGMSRQQPFRLIETPAGMQVLDYRYLAHIVEKRQHLRERYAHYLIPALERPLEVWRTLYDDATERLRYIGVFDAEKDVLVVVRINRDGSIVWNLMQGTDKALNSARAGRLVWPRPQE